MSKINDLNKDIMNIQGRSLDEVKKDLETSRIRISYQVPAARDGLVTIDTSDAVRVAYALGLRDARHAAIDLVLKHLVGIRGLS